jgi:hypothetical protein
VLACLLALPGGACGAPDDASAVVFPSSGDAPGGIVARAPDTATIRLSAWNGAQQPR